MSSMVNGRPSHALSPCPRRSIACTGELAGERLPRAAPTPRRTARAGAAGRREDRRPARVRRQRPVRRADRSGRAVMRTSRTVRSRSRAGSASAVGGASPASSTVADRFGVAKREGEVAAEQDVPGADETGEEGDRRTGQGGRVVVQLGQVRRGQLAVQRAVVGLAGPVPAVEARRLIRQVTAAVHEHEVSRDAGRAGRAGSVA